MHVIILAAGKSQRFQDAGYSIPKPFLPIKWQGLVDPMVNHVIRTIPAYFHKISLAVSSEYVDIASQIKGDFGRNITVIDVGQTNGPAHSAFKVLDQVSYVHATLILDSDVLNNTNDLWWLCQQHSCSVLVSKSNNPAHSYVANLRYFDRIKEKKCISEYAVCGAYYIPRPLRTSFKYHLHHIVDETGEPFISHVLDDMEEQKFAMKTSYNPIDWGTPEDVFKSGATICT